MAFAHLWNTWTNRRARRAHRDAQPAHRRPGVRWPRLPLRMESLEDRIAPDGTPLEVALGDFNAAAATLRLNGEWVQVVRSGAHGDTLAERALVDVSEVRIIGDPARPEAVTIDFESGGFFWVPDGIKFSGGTGADDELLVKTSRDLTWTVTGPGEGTIDAGISFTGVEHLTGAVGNDDTFLFEAAGSIAGIVDGGDAGNDALSLVSGTFGSVTFTAISSEVGTIARDDDLITFRGLEPAADNTPGPKIVNDTVGASNILVSAADGGLGVRGPVTVSGDTFPESFVFTGMTGGDSLTINAGTGNDRVTIRGPSFDLGFVIVNGGEGNDVLDARDLVFEYSGGDGRDTLVFSRDAAMILRDSKLTQESIGFSSGANLSSVERAVMEVPRVETSFAFDGTKWTGQLIHVSGIPDWVPQGPGPYTGGQVTNIPDSPVSGAIHTVALHPFDLSSMYVGTANGGVWRNSDISVLFDFNQSTLKPAATARLRAFADFLIANPTLNVSIVGHTDDIGTPEFNQGLSETRAVVVKNFLVGEGVNESRLTDSGQGLTNPIAPNSTEAGRVLNRRVELLVNHWVPLTDQFPSLAISELAISPRDADDMPVTASTSTDKLVIYAGTGAVTSGASLFSGIGQASATGILKSTDGGKTWKLLDDLKGGKIEAIKVFNDGTLLVGTDGRNGSGNGLFFSNDEGETFFDVRADLDPTVPAGAVTDIALDPANAQRAYAGIAGNGVFVTEDGGATWSPMNNGLTNLSTATRIMLAVSPLIDTDTSKYPVYAATLGQINSLTGPSAAGTLTIQVPANTIVEAGDTIELGGAGTDGADNDGDGPSDALDPSEAGLRERWKVTAIGAIVGGTRTVTLRAANADQLDNDLDGTPPDSGAETAVPNRGLFNAWGIGATVTIKPGSVSQRLSGIFRTEDDGASWVAMPLPGTIENGNFFGIHPGAQGRNHFSMVADPFSANGVFVGGDRQARPGPNGMEGDNDDGGTNSVGANDYNGRLFRGNFTDGTWQPITHNGASGTAPHADSRHLIVRGLHLIEVDDGGIYQLRNFPTAGRDWESLNADLSLSQFYSVAYDSIFDVMLGGTQDNGTALQSLDPNASTNPGPKGSTAWTNIKGGDGSIVQFSGRMVGEGPGLGTITNRPFAHFSSQNFGGFAIGARTNTDQVTGDMSVTVDQGFPVLVGDTVVVGGSNETIASITPQPLGNLQLTFQNGINVDLPRGSIVQFRPALRIGGPAGTPLSTQSDRNLQFVNPFVLNTNNPNFILIGTSSVYESANNGRTLTRLRTASGGTTIGKIKPLIYGGTQPDGLGGFTATPTVIYVGTDPGAGARPTAADNHALWLRQANVPANGRISPVTSYTREAGAAVVDIAVDPKDWRHVYVLDANGHIWFSPNAGQTNVFNATGGAGTTNAWKLMTVNLHLLPGAGLVQQIAVARPDATTTVLFASGQGGVFRKIGDGRWHEYGEGLPNALTTALENMPAIDNVLIAGTFGRGAWMIPETNFVGLGVPAAMTFTGSAGNDVFVIERSATHPWLLNVYQFLDTEIQPDVPSFSIPFNSLESITINGGDGEDRFVIDPAAGALLSSRHTITIDGGDGATDTVELHGPEDSTALSFSSVSGTPPGPGGYVSTITDVFGNSAVQTITWSNLEFVDTTNLTPVPRVVGVVGTGLDVLADSLTDAMTSALASANLPGIDGRSLAAALNGLTVNSIKPESDALVTATQVPGSDLVQIDNGRSVLLRILEAGGLNVAAIGSAALSDPTELELALENLDGDPSNNSAEFIGGLGPLDDKLFKVTLEDAVLNGILDLDVASTVLGGLGHVGLTGLLEVAMKLDLSIAFGVDANGFFIKTDGDVLPKITVTDVTISGEAVGSGQLGFLGVDVKDATLTLGEGVELVFELHDPKTDADDQKIRMPELLADSAAGLVSFVVDAGSQPSPDLVIDAQMDVSGLIPGVDSAIPLATAGVKLTWANIAAPEQVAVTAGATPGSDIAEFLRFTKVTSADVLGGLQEFRSHLDTLATLPGSPISVPILQNGLSDVIDVVEAVNERIIDPLTASDGVSAGFGTLQELAVNLAEGLGIDPAALGLSFANGVLTYNVDLHHTLASAGGNIGVGFGLPAGLEVEASAGASFNADVDLDFNFGVDVGGIAAGGAILDNVFVQDVVLGGSADLNITDIDARARFGFASINVTNGTGNVTDAAIRLTLNDPDGATDDADGGRINLSELDDGLANLDDFVSGSVSGSASLTLPVTVPFLGTSATVGVSVPDFANPTNVTITGLGELGNFGNIDAVSLVGLLGQVTAWLDEVRRSDEFANFDVPLVGPALDQVLGIADAFRDKLLIDDNDTGPDDAKTLLFDINAALDAAGLGAKIRAENDGGSIKLIAIDSDIAKFTVAGATGLGFGATQVSSGTAVYESVKASGAAPADGKLLADATFTITMQALTATFNAATAVDAANDKLAIPAHGLHTGDSVVYDNGGGTDVGGLTDGVTYYVIRLDDNNIKLADNFQNATATTPVPRDLTAGGAGADHTLRHGQAGAVEVTVLKADTNANDRIGDDRWKLVNAQNAPTFRTVDEMVPKLIDVLGIQDLTYNPSDDTLTFSIDLSDTFGQLDLPLGFSLDDLPDFLKLQTSGNVRLAATGGLNLTLGVFLGPAEASTQLTGNEDLDQVNGGIDISTDHRITGSADVRTVYGQLSGDAHFALAVNGTSPVNVTVTEAAAANNATVADLVADINAALTTAGLSAQVQAQAVTGTPGQQRVKLVGQTGATSLVLTTTPSDPAVKDMGFAAQQPAAGAPAATELVATKDLPALRGRLTADAAFEVSLANVNSGAPVGVTLQAASTATNRFSFDIVGDVQAAIDAQAALKGKIEVGFSDDRLTFTAKDGSASFTISAASTNPAVTELGLGTTNTGDSADFVITTRGGGRHGITLDGLTKLQQVIDEIDTQSKHEVTAKLNDRKTGLILTDNTFDDVPAGTGKFQVLIANNSTAALGLGIVQADAPEGETPDGVIQGTEIAGLTPLDRFFIKATPEGEDPLASVGVVISTPTPVTASASFGFVGLSLTGGGALPGPGNKALDANLTVRLNEPAGSTDGNVSLAELINGLDDIGSLLDLSLTGQGKAEFHLLPDPALADLGITLGTDARIAAAVNLGDVFADPAIQPTVTFTYPDFGDLIHFGNLNLNFQSIIAGLRALTAFLDQFEAFDFLDKPLPVASVSLKDLLGVADKFAAAIDDARANPAGTIQLLEEKLKQAFGLPPSSTAIDLSLVNDNNATPTNSDDDFRILRLDLDLVAAFSESVGLDFDLGSLLELGGGADLTAAGSAALKLAVGFDIEDPTRVFLFKDTGLDGTLNLGGDGLSFRAAVGPVGVFVNGGTADIHGTLTDGKLFKAAFNDLAYVNNRYLIDFADLDALFDGFTAQMGGLVDVDLPVFFPTDSIRAGTVLFDANLSYDPEDGFAASANPRAVDASGNPISLAQLFAFDPSKLSLLDQLLLGVDGMDLFLEGLQDVLDGQIGGFSLPLIGDKLAGAADVIGDFRSNFVEGLRTALEQLANPGAAFAAAGGQADPVSKILFNLLGPGGLELLKDYDPLDGETVVDVHDVRFVTNINQPGVPAADVYFDWDFKLGDHVDAGAGIGFDIGIPGLGLETTGAVDVDLDWELALGFGLNYADGFYFDIADDSEFQLDVDVTVPGIGIKGTLGFLQVTAEEDVDPTAPDPVTHLGATFAVDIQNRSDPDDDKLGFAELGRIGIDAKIGADAVADLAMRLALSSDLVPNAPTNFPSVVADFLLDWRLGDREAGDYVSMGDLDGGFLSNGLQFVGFDHVGVDLGSYFTDLIGPIVEKVQEVTEPIKPFLDFLTEPIPVISQLAGPTSLLDIAAMSGAVNPGIIKAIEVVDQVVDIANSISVPVGGNVILYFDRWLDTLVIFDAAHPPLGGLPDLTNPNLDLEGLADDLLGGLGEFLPADLAAALGEVGGNLAAGVNKMLPGGSASAGFQLPIIKDPSQVFGMLMGQQADLVTFTMDALTVEADFSAFFSIFGPLGVSINAEFDGQFGPFKFGYDTLGITEFAKSGFKNPLLLFDGLYVSDLGVFTDTETDVPELQFDAGLWAAAELNLGIARGGVGGGLFAEIDMDLHDPDADGRVRLKEIVTSVLNEFRYGNPALSPLAMFDITGKLTAELFAFLKINFPWPIPDIDKKFQITKPIVLLDFESDFERFPTLATELPGGVLQLNMGKFADQRVEGDKTDGSEHFKAKQGSDASHILVWAPSLGVDMSEAQEYKVTSRILGLGGEGNDIIDLSGVTGNYEYELEGNAGNDTVLAGSGNGAARILGGAGDDNLSGGGGDDVVFGETGNDVVAGGGGRDWLFGDGSVKDAIQTDSVTNRTTITGAVKANDGTDSIYGGAGEDIAFGSGGVDYIEGGPDADVLIGDGGKVTVGTDRLVVTLRSLLVPPEPDAGRLELAVEDTSKGQGAVDTIHGDGGNDHVYGGPAGDFLHGGDDADVIYGEAGKDTIEGNAGNDIAFGDFGTFALIDGVLTPVTTVGGEADLIYGGTDNDQLLGGAGDDIIVGDAGDDWAWGGTGLDEIHGGDNADHLYGNADPDRLFGEAGPDFIEGGHGNDLGLGGTGNDLLIAGYGSDVIDGEEGSDAYQITARGGAVTELSIAYDSGTLATDTDTLTLVGTADPDTVLLRAMADFYFPSQVKLIGDASSKGLTDKVFASGEPDKLAALLQAIEDAYGPHDIPAGLMSELIDLFVAEIKPGVLDAISSSYVADPDPESTVPALEDLIALVDQPGDPGDPEDDFGILNTDSRGKLAEIQKAIKAAYGDNPVPGSMFDRITNSFNTFTPPGGLQADLEAAIADHYQSEALVGLLGIVRDEFGAGPATEDSVLAMIDRIVTAYSPGIAPEDMINDLAAAFEDDPADLDGLLAAITDNYDPTVPVPGLETDTGFVALINNGGANVERFNYRNMEGLVINTLQGEDYVVSDDVIGATTINLGIDDDRVQIGQVFRSERTRDPGNELITGITAEDVYTTTEITRGWLSNGVSRPTTINGGDGDDQFTVFRNVAVLNLNGGDGDDLFTVRAFALKGSSDSERARTDMKGDGGADTILYVVNAPVGIDGGDGLDTVRVIGTEFADDFVVTDSGVFGAGLNVTFVNIEKLVADGAEGDDRYFVLSTGLDVVTEIDGGLGSDTFFVGGNPSGAPIPVISDDFRGHSGIILHSVESTDTAWDDLKVEGLSANIGDNEQDYILVTESGGSSRVVEGATAGGAGWVYDGYSIRLTQQPGPGQVVTINVVLAGMSPEDRARQFRDLEFFEPNSLDDLDGAPHGDPLGFNPLTDLPNLPSVQFDATNWYKPQFIKFRAADQGQYRDDDDPPGPPFGPPFGSVADTASEGRRFTFINHTAQNSTDPDYRDAQLLSVKVQMEDNDRDGVIVTPTARGNTILEGGFEDSYNVVLAQEPTADVTVALSVLNGQVTLTGTTLMFPAGVPTLTFTPDNWDEPQTITLTAVDDAVLEGFHTDYISYKVQSADVTETIPLSGFIQVDGNFDQLGVQSIPADKPTTYVLLPHKPVPGTVSVKVGGVSLDPARFSVAGNTLSFLTTDGTAELRIGKVEAQYSYVEPGYEGSAVRDTVVDIYDNDAPTVIVEPTNGSTDVIEVDPLSPMIEVTDTYRVRLSRAPSSSVQVKADAVKTRTTYGRTAHFVEQVTVNGTSDTVLTFTPTNWDQWQVVTVAAINDDFLDGNDTQVFAPDLQTVNKIRGPLIVEGAAGLGSLSLPAPLMLPHERNALKPDGTVVAFTAGSGPGATETMIVQKADLLAVVAELQTEDSTITSVEDLVGKTLEMAKGPGTGVILDPARPEDLYDRFWLINAVQDLGVGTVELTLQNPTAVDPALLEPGDAPDTTSQYAITALSLNFFADEREQVDYLFVFDEDSVANDAGALTSSDGAVLGFDAAAQTMTVETSALQAVAKLDDLNNVEALEERQIEITVGPGVGRAWTIDEIENVVVDGNVVPGIKRLVLVPVTPGADPTDRSEFRIAGGDTHGRVVGFGMGPNVLFSGRPQPGGITYGDMEVVQVSLGSGNDTVRVDYATNSDDHTTKRAGKFYTLTLLDTGKGNDTVNVELTDGDDGAVSISTQAGNDVVNGGASTLPLVVFGGDGNDQITGGSAADILFGDVGRVDYVKTVLLPDGTPVDQIVTRLGHSVPPNPVNPHVTGATARTVSDSAITFPTDQQGLVGLSVQAISPQGHVQFRTIVANDEHTITVDRPWDETPVFGSTDPDDDYYYRVSSMPEDQTDGVVRAPKVIWSIDRGIGGSDVIHAGPGADFAFGGAASDTIEGDAGADVIFGDSGRVDLTGQAYPAGLVTGDPVVKHLFATDTEEATGGADVVHGNTGDDIVLGGVNNDVLNGDAGDDKLLGDNGEFVYDDEDSPDLATLDAVRTLDTHLGGGDVIHGDAGADLVLAGTGDDTGSGGAGDDIVFGDFAEALLLGNLLSTLRTMDPTLGGSDVLSGDGEDDVLVGGARGDSIDGGRNEDLIFGDAVEIHRRPGHVIANPRFRTLTGTRIYARADLDGNSVESGKALVNDAARDYRDPAGSPAPDWAEFEVIDLRHTAAIQAANDGSFGNDYIAGGTEHDQIFGQLGDDTIQGDGSVTTAAAVSRTPGGVVITPSLEDPNDGDDYIEGNGGSDMVFGGLGQDDIVGGSSNLFTLDLYSERPDGADVIFGGAGRRAGRLADVGTGDQFYAERHARDADTVLGDNGNIYRLVGTAGTDGRAPDGSPITGFLTFNYDTHGLAADGYSPARRIVARAVSLIDYTPGGPDFTSTAEPGAIAQNAGGLFDIGAADEVHGESGDDFLYGMVGKDVMYGDAQDDNMVGGYDADWMSGGNGDDGILGDDGRSFASRNGTYGEPLYGVAGFAQADLNKLITLPGQATKALTNVDGLLKYTADLTPDNLKPTASPPDPLFRPLYANDIIYGGLGQDAIHAGAGDDAVSGAEAPVVGFTNNYDQVGTKLNGAPVPSDFYHPVNPGNVLGYSSATTKLAQYDANDSLRRVMLDPVNGSLWKGPAAAALPWLLDFHPDEGPPDTKWIAGTNHLSEETDGDDHLFADLGNDWAVGGTGRDVMYGGWGDDVLNMDDVPTTNGGLNNGTDTNPSWEDLGYGGAGRDVLIMNTNGDRGFDWVGEFNTFRTPFAQFGSAAVNRLLLPNLPEFLYALSRSEGADPTLAARYGTDPARNGEPFGELGLVPQSDAAWGAQSGSPRDPQGGNLPGGPVDVKNNPGTAGLGAIYSTAVGGKRKANRPYLAEAELAPVVAQAKQFWAAAVGAGRAAELDRLQVVIGDLPNNRLGAVVDGVIVIDGTAAGRGWFVDPTPADSSEFAARARRLLAAPASPAFGQMDLLSVVLHEIGHMLGLDHELGGVMGEKLRPGERTLPELAPVPPVNVTKGGWFLSRFYRR